MSLEQTLQENNALLKQLIETIVKYGTATVIGSKVLSPADTTVPAAGVDEQPSQPEATGPLPYEYIQKPFLKLVNKDRDTAIALLAELGAKKLDAFKGKDKEYPRILQLIEEKLNG